MSRSRTIIIISVSILVALSIGFTIGWFAKPTSDQSDITNSQIQQKQSDFREDFIDPKCKHVRDLGFFTSMQFLKVPVVENWTMSMWASLSKAGIKRHESIGSDLTIGWFFMRANIHFDIAMFISPEGPVTVKMRDRTIVPNATSSSVTVGRYSWNHYAMVKRQSTLEFYVNGELSGTLMIEPRQLPEINFFDFGSIGIIMGFKARYCPNALDSAALKKMIQSDSYLLEL